MLNIASLAKKTQWKLIINTEHKDSSKYHQYNQISPYMKVDVAWTATHTDMRRFGA